MTDTTQLPPLPDRLSINPQSRRHNPDVLKHEVGIMLNGKEHTNVCNEGACGQAEHVMSNNNFQNFRDAASADSDLCMHLTA